MATKINYETKTDRELLLISVEKLNDLTIDFSHLQDKVNNKVDKALAYALLSVLGSFILGMIVYVMRHVGFPAD